MPLELDGAEVLRAVLANPAVFTVGRQELARMAQSLVVKQLRSRDTGVEELRGLVAALGGEPFRLIADAMTDAEVRSVTLRLDPHNPGARSADASWLRGHLFQLADGEAEPAEKPEAGKPEAEPPAQRTLSSRAMAAIARPRDDAPPPKAKEGKGKEAKEKAKGKKKAKK